MPALSLAPVLSLFATFTRVPPTRPLRTWLRTTGHRLRPPRLGTHIPSVDTRQSALLADGSCGLHQRATILTEPRRGGIPTLVLPGFVPDAHEQIYLLRSHLLGQGSVYYFNYPHNGFSTELLFAQLDDLVDELVNTYGTPPVLFGVSFGAGLITEWLRQRRLRGLPDQMRGIVLVSPVTCLEDIVETGTAKPGTLLGRAVSPLLADAPPPSALEKARTLFIRMFEAGAQNTTAFTALLSRNERLRLRDAVHACIRRITTQGASERFQSLRTFSAPAPGEHLTSVPTLVLFAEDESSVLTAKSPTISRLSADNAAGFPLAAVHKVQNRRGQPVQHASLLFHAFNFLPPIARFYRGLKSRKVLYAA